MSLLRSAPVQLLTFQLYQLWIGEFPPTLMYQKSFRHFFVGIETSIFHRLGCWVEGWEVGGALLCFAFRPHRSVGMKNILSSLDVLVVLLFFGFCFFFKLFYSAVFILTSVWCIHSSLFLSFPTVPWYLLLSFTPSPSSPPLLLLFDFSSIHLKSGSFPGGESVVELQETTSSDLFIVLRVFVVLLRLFAVCPFLFVCGMPTTCIFSEKQNVKTAPATEKYLRCCW